MVNLGMVVTKGVGGWVFNSQALVSYDAPLAGRGEARRWEACEREVAMRELKHTSITRRPHRFEPAGMGRGYKMNQEANWRQ